MSDNVIQSAGGFVYYLDSNGEPRFLIVKRHALSGKIERIAPKGKVQEGEETAEGAVREVSEETGIPINQIKLKDELGTTKLRMNNADGAFNKDITYFLMEYTGDPDMVDIQTQEGFLGVHKRANISEVLSLVYYNNIRELIRKAYHIIKEKQKKNDIKKDFMNLID